MSIEPSDFLLAFGSGPADDDTALVEFGASADSAIKGGRVPMGDINIALTDDVEPTLSISVLMGRLRSRKQFPALKGGEAFSGSMQEAGLMNDLNAALSARRGIILATGTSASVQVVLIGYIQ